MPVCAMLMFDKDPNGLSIGELAALDVPLIPPVEPATSYEILLP